MDIIRYDFGSFRRPLVIGQLRSTVMQTRNQVKCSQHRSTGSERSETHPEVKTNRTANQFPSYNAWLEIDLSPQCRNRAELGGMMATLTDYGTERDSD